MKPTCAGYVPGPGIGFVSCQLSADRAPWEPRAVRSQEQHPQFMEIRRIDYVWTGDQEYFIPSMACLRERLVDVFRYVQTAISPPTVGSSSGPCH
jgi:hypothetical protein